MFSFTKLRKPWLVSGAASFTSDDSAARNSLLARYQMLLTAH